MKTKQIEKKILEKIKREGIKPKPRSYFVIRNLSFWGLSFSFVLVGGISFASILYKISDSYSILQSVFNNSFSILHYLFYLVPYFWLAILFIFLILAIINFKKTEFSYRYNINLILLYMLLSVVVLGVFMFYLGVSQKTEILSQKYIPFYDRYTKIVNLRKQIFVQKMVDLGFTAEFLNNNPDIKKEVEKKFQKNVLGKMYIYGQSEECKRETFVCQNDEIFFKDNEGCGCRQIYVQLKGLE